MLLNFDAINIKILESQKYNSFEFSQTDTMLSRIYGLTKIHKPGFLLRLVVPSINNSKYFLSQQYSHTNIEQHD